MRKHFADNGSVPGALNGLMAEVIEGHIWFHVLPEDHGKNSPQAEAAEELIDVVRTYLR